jgi:hypothetical protein
MDGRLQRPAILLQAAESGSSLGIRRDRLHRPVVHTYEPTPNAFILVTLRDKAGYLALEGIGPLRAPLSGPRTRECAYIGEGKGGRVSATPSLPCAQAERLYRHYASNYPPGNPRGYRCRSYGLPPWGSDAGVTSCTSGARAFVFTSNQ